MAQAYENAIIKLPLTQYIEDFDRINLSCNAHVYKSSVSDSANEF
jgi:hypothetical protein